MSRQDADRPMPLAEADACCGTARLVHNEQVAMLFCENCPLIIDRLDIAAKREGLLREARAL